MITFRSIAVVVMTGAALGACKPKAAADVLVDVKPTVVARTTQCTVPNDDGVRCDRKTCKKDQRSDCSNFADGCTKYGHVYEGDNDSGECIRQPGSDNTG